MTAAERMARLRARQREVGLATLTVVVPVHDVAGFVRLAARRRNARGKDGVDRARPVRWATRAVASASISSSDILAFRELLETTAVTIDGPLDIRASDSRLSCFDVVPEATSP